MDTSKTRSIKSLLLQAWRERWSDVSWGIRIKSVLPRGVSGDVYDLADCILQQALVGPGPNNLFMSYLMHSLSSRVVSYGAVLSSIGRYQSFYKPYCILSLLDLLKTFQSRIGCHGNEEECIALCKAVVSVTHWLYSCVFHSLTKLTELKQSPEHISIMEKSYEVLYYFSNSTFIKSLLFVGKNEDQSMYAQMMQKHRELEDKISQVPMASVNKEIIEGVLLLVSSVDKLPLVPVEQTCKNNDKFQMVASTLNIMVTLDAVLNPVSDITAFANQLLLVKELQNFKLSHWYCEIMRSCFTGIVDSLGMSEDDLRLFAFTFLKLPSLMARLHSLQNDKEDNAIEKGLKMLMHFSPLLDLADYRSICDCIQYLSNEFFQSKMLTEAQRHDLVTRRQNEIFKPMPKPPTPKPSSQICQTNVALILRAKGTLVKISESLSSDYSKVQEPVLGPLLNALLTPRNLKLILSSAASTGQLRSFFSKMIAYNDYNISSVNENGETTKAAECRATMFEVTFLLLIYSTQYLGIDVVVSSCDRKDAFFVRWATECLAEGGKFKCPELLLSKCNQETVDSLLAQFLNTDEKFETQQVRWNDVCFNAPAAAKEILIAWEHGALSTEKVKAILDHIKGQMCFLPVCISAWLCNYINVLHHEERLKPINMLQQFMAPLPQVVPMPQVAAEATGPQTPEQTYSERSSLMIGIITIMMCDLHPNLRNVAKQSVPVITHGLTVKTPLGKILDEVFNGAHCQGFLDVKAVHSFETLLCVGGARWLCDVLVRKILTYQFSKDLTRAVDMTIGIFNLDIEQCTLALLLHTLPFYLYSESHQENLAEPYGTALSRLAVITTYIALQSRQSSFIKAGSKRTHREVDIDDARDHTEHCRPSKIHRSNAELLEDTPFELQSLSDEHIRSAVANPINKAIADLMRTLLVIASDSTISARSYFPIRFLEQVVLCAKDKASTVLQFMPLGLVGLLLKKYPEEFSHELILAVSSMQSPRARKVASLSLCQLTIAQNRLKNKNNFEFSL